MEANNMAEMRKALQEIHDRVNSLDEECGVDPIDVRDIARAALSAPPRNCDVYDCESCRMAYHLYGDGHMSMQAFADWLFAPATYPEGKDYGSK